MLRVRIFRPVRPQGSRDCPRLSSWGALAQASRGARSDHTRRRPPDRPLASYPISLRGNYSPVSSAIVGRPFAHINVALVDGQPLFRQGVTNAIIGSRLVVVAEGGTADDARRAARKCKPDILLFDIGVPGDGIRAIRDALRLRPTMKVVILTGSDAEQDVVDALRVGALGYILKDISGSALVSAIEAIHRGEPYITSSLASRLLIQSGEPSLADKTEKVDLTPRDKQILGHLAKGLTTREIGRSLGICVSTVTHCKSELFRKLRVRNRIEAILKAQLNRQAPTRLFSTRLLPEPKRDRHARSWRRERTSGSS